MGLGDALVLGLAALLPVALLSLTSFVKISVVLSLLRSALGTPDAPSSLVVMGISLVLTGAVMTPVLQEMASSVLHATRAAPVDAASPPGPDASKADASKADASKADASKADASKADASKADDPTRGASWRQLVPPARHGEVEAALAAVEPLRRFLAAHADPADRASFAELARSTGREAQADELAVVAPAFITSELKRAFVMAIVLLLPFLVIDLVVGLTLAALGATTMSPQAIALPLKLLLFVAVDGWRLLLDALLRGYA